jgi:hypothetical protein
MSRKDSFGVEVEKGDIVLSCPKHKWSGNPEVGRVSGVFDSGRVTIQVPHKVTIYAYQRGAPDVERTSQRWVTDRDAEPDKWGRRPYKQESYTYMSKDYTVVGHEWKWVRKQAADITLIVLRKEGEEKKDLSELLAERIGFNDLTRNLNLDYSTEKPDLDTA